MEPPRFAVDRMLGRLARWLRVLGFDAVHRPDLPGRRLLTLAAREGRVLLTRDRQLCRARTPVEVVCIAGDRFRDQLRELDARHALAPALDRRQRCVECNREVVPIARDALPASVPEYVRATQSEFHRCPRCARVYWRATHWQRMRDEIDRLGLRPSVEASAGAA